MSACPPSLHRRITTLVLLLGSGLLALSALLWVHSTRQGIHEEVEAANRVASQWIQVLIASHAYPSGETHLLAQLSAVGRLRANGLEVIGLRGTLRYQSPPSAYKVGRNAPEWFAELMAPQLPPREIIAGEVLIRLTPDPSRAILDAWDELSSIGMGGLLLLSLLGLALRLALNRILAPLDTLAAALSTTATGGFDHRLPPQASRELDQLASRYNQMGEALATTLSHNAELQAQQLVASQLNQHLQTERQILARELHDELGQGITAVRAIAGAMAQRSENEGLAHYHGSAQAVLAMTSQMQAGVRLILHRLRHPAENQPLEASLAEHAQRWQSLHPDIKLSLALPPCPPELPADYAQCLLRVMQEALTNIARHAQAQHVEIRLCLGIDGLKLSIRDDGIGCRVAPNGWQFGLLGMKERVETWQGEFHLQSTPQGGTLIRATLPWPFTLKEAPHVLSQA